MLAKYTPSGSVDGRFFVWAPLSLAAAGALGSVYQLLMHFIPYIMLDLLICCGMGLLTGAVVGVLSRKSHCRNPLAGAGLGLAAALVALAAGHLLEYALNGAGSVGFWDYIQARANAGWSVGKGASSTGGRGTISGIWSYLIWGIEAAIICGFAVLGGYNGTGKPYCEGCGAWADYKMAGAAVKDPAAAVVAAVAGAGSVMEVIERGRSASPGLAGETATGAGGAGADGAEGAEAAGRPGAPPALPSALLYEVSSCPECKAFHTLRVTHEATKVKGAKREVELTELHEGVLMTSEEVAALALMPGAVIRRAG